MIRRVDLPLAPVWLGMLFPINYLCSILLLRWVSSESRDLGQPILEIKEFIVGALFLALVCSWALDQRRRRTTALGC